MIEHIITSSILILAVILIRAVFQKRISRRVCYAIWLLVVVKLVIPLSGVPNHLNVMNILSSQISGYEKIFVSSVTPNGEQVFDDSNDKKNVAKIANNVEGTPKKRQDTEYNIEPVEEWIGAKSLDFTGNRGNFPESFSDAEEGDDGILDSGYRKEEDVLRSTDLAEHEKSSIAFVFVMIWVVGSGIIACIMLISNLVFRRRLYKNRRMAEGTFSHQKPLIYVTEEVEIPCLFGLWHPLIYITKEHFEKDAGNLEMIIMHETVHYRHMDHIWSFVRCLLLVIYWWNPLVLIAAGLSVVDSELACDEEVIAKLGEQYRKAYGESLIAIGTDCRKSTNLLVCGVGLAGRNRELKTRMKYLVGKRKQSAAAVVLTCMLLAGSAGCTFGGVSKQDLSSKQEQAEDIQEYKSGGRMLVRDVDIVEGAEKWKAFKSAVIAGQGTEEEPLIITIELHFDEETYTKDLSFDGQSFLYDGRKWKYLLDLDGISGNPESENRKAVLTNEIVTYEELEWSFLSSQMDDQIDCAILFFVSGSVEGDKVCYAPADGSVQMSADEREKEEQTGEETEGMEASIKATSKPQDGAVNIGYSPVVFGDDGVRYFVPEEKPLREKLLIALENLSPQNEAGDGGIVGKQSLGCFVIYNGVEWELFSENCLVTWIENESGELVQIMETPETNWNCVNICEYVLDVLREEMHYEPVDVTAWTGITAATLDYVDDKTKKRASQTITDEETLKRLEQWFSQAEVVNGGSGCPFYSAMLTFNFENGEKVSMMVAEDSCPVFKINGVYYDYRPAEYRGWGWDNETFMKLFDEIPFRY